MKKVFTVLISFVLIFIQTNIVFAENKACYVEELDVTISIPDDYDVFTRSMSSNDPLFYEYGIDPDGLKAYFTETNTYLQAISQDGLCDVMIDALDNEYDDFRYLSDIVLNLEAKIFVDGLLQDGLEILDVDICHNKQSKFIKVYVDASEYGLQYIQYITSLDNKIYYITVRTYENEFSEEMLSYAEEMIQSFTFESKPLMEDLWEKTESFVYTCEYSGASFTVPEDYKIDEDFSVDIGFDETANTAFVSTHDEGVAITYNCLDVYDEVNSDFYGFERNEIDFSIITEEDLANELEGLKHIETVNIGDESYYKAVIEQNIDVEGYTFNREIVLFTTVKDGWMHSFMFIDGENSIYYNNLIELLESVEYPYISSKTPIVTLPRIIILALVLIVYLLKRKLKPKKKLTVTDDQFKEQDDSSNLSVAENRCPECGTLLLTGSERCYKCGKDINKV